MFTFLSDDIPRRQRLKLAPKWAPAHQPMPRPILCTAPSRAHFQVLLHQKERMDLGSEFWNSRRIPAALTVETGWARYRASERGGRRIEN